MLILKNIVRLDIIEKVSLRIFLILFLLVKTSSELKEKYIE